jgi:cytochrome oxidase Cu insertion factor (SCO1/SenC/PrrC family)
MRNRYHLVVLAATLGVAIGLGAALLRTSHTPAAREEVQPLKARVTWPAEARRAPVFSLRDQRGAAFSLAALRGHPVLLTFLDSRCRRECPVAGREVADVQRRTAGTGLALVVVSVDPWADTARSVRSFAAHAQWHGDWRWLFGGQRQLRRVWQSYDIAVKRTPAGVLHGTTLYVIDARGDVRAAYLFQVSADTVAREVRDLASSD